MPPPVSTSRMFSIYIIVVHILVHLTLNLPRLPSRKHTQQSLVDAYCMSHLCYPFDSDIHKLIWVASYMYFCSWYTSCYIYIYIYISLEICNLIDIQSLNMYPMHVAVTHLPEEDPHPSNCRNFGHHAAYVLGVPYVRPGTSIMSAGIMICRSEEWHVGRKGYTTTCCYWFPHVHTYSPLAVKGIHVGSWARECV